MKRWCFLLLSLMSVGCGVKGDPLPPEEPATIGRGHPTYKRAIEGLELRTEPTDDEEQSQKKSKGD